MAIYFYQIYSIGSKVSTKVKITKKFIIVLKELKIYFLDCPFTITLIANNQRNTICVVSFYRKASSQYDLVFG